MSYADVVLYGQIKGSVGETPKPFHHDWGEITQMEDYGRRIADMGFQKTRLAVWNTDTPQRVKRFGCLA